ncbi:NucA/NucB deoxyribonuclease domain-containing protein [Streptomyces griseofuscus]|uniref:NucA/NucB deoxyribonuclease domain-containing protein n=1 Tax=Streptomyces griseofuscus TaxID=146922 RepID=UPI0036F648E8
MRKLATTIGAAILVFTATTQTANAAAQQPAAASPCTAVGSNLYNRTYACAKVHHSVPVIAGTKEGLVDAVTAHEIQLNVKSRTFTDKVSLEIRGYTGDANISGLTLSLSVSCGGSCKASVAGLRGIPVKIGEKAQGTVTFSDSTTTQHRTKASYSFAPSPGFSGPGIRETSPEFRCDNLIGGQGAGCVFPGYIPTMTSMATLPNIAANIRRIQAAGPSHFGRKADGKPLTRSTNPKVESNNRKVACPSSRKRPAGKSCDEYPFAKTNQGASLSKQPDWGWAWVPASEQNSQGGRVGAFWKSDRVLDGDPFWVAA